MNTENGNKKMISPEDSVLGAENMKHVEGLRAWAAEKPKNRAVIVSSVEYNVGEEITSTNGDACIYGTNMGILLALMSAMESDGNFAATVMATVIHKLKGKGASEVIELNR